MFRKILIANRGEIACRVIETARRLGVATVAVHSDADAGAKHVAMADEAVHIGPAPAAESYLRADRIIEAAKATGAEAIHPGYGFLSENPDFVEQVETAGLTFIGPSASAIRAMGLKDAAKKLMEEAGVPVVPGYHGAEQNPDFLAGEADAIGYPVLIKARAGGGGKGMRRVDRPEDFRAALDGAMREGKASFGDASVLIEKYVTAPRHIEIQVFGDKHGDAVYLFERDCSLQRRHQKVIEEAPAPGMTEDMRAAMGAAAVRAAKAIGYSGAGTVEFIVDASDGLRADRFWFMEMNTRLQVEHPVTEMITYLDLVEWQLRVAAGDPLPMRQEDLAINGWAFEARIYAEDVPKGFLPATGRLAMLRFPAGARADSGVREGDEITPWYDPMIAKLITHGPTREAALNALSAALAETRIAGTVTNIAFLSALTRHEGFRRGEVDTGLIGRDLEALVAAPEADAGVFAVAALAAYGALAPRPGEDPWAALHGFRLWSPASREVTLVHGEESRALRVEELGAGRYRVDGAEVAVLAFGPEGARLRLSGREVTAEARRHGGKLTLFLDGAAHEFALPDPLARSGAAAAGGDSIASPMPGLVKVVSAKPGTTVARGDALIVLEAMKMEHTLTAPRDGVVAELLAAEGDQVQEGALLLTLEAEE
jgi:3-methylcrotonyl-CoA carboxylase alpha subunit